MWDREGKMVRKGCVGGEECSRDTMDRNGEKRVQGSDR